MSITALAASKAGHPRALYYLFFTEMWERFSFYGMKALLLAYMVTQLRFDEPRSYAILGSYSALVYAIPVFGGWLADRILGFRKAIYFGGMLMAIGHLVLAIPQAWSFYYGMAFIICGNGFFKPNISSLVGTLYEKDDPKKDSAFSLFYMGINIGAALGGATCGYVGQRINWHLGFGLAGIFMIVGLIIFSFGQKMLNQKGIPPGNNGKRTTLISKPETAVYFSTLAFVPVIVVLFHLYEAMNSIMFGLAAAALVYLLYTSRQLDRPARFRLFAAIAMIISSVLFWAFYSQNTGSLNLYAMRNVNMHFLGMELAPLAVNNFLPPFWVISLSPVFAWIWLLLIKKGKEPSTPVKFGVSFLFIALAFSLLFLAGTITKNGMVPLWIFVGSYALLISGELCLSPIGLSMITRLSPGGMVGMMMGTWFLATALGEFLASKIGSLMSVPAGISDPVATLPYYQAILLKIAIGATITGAIVLLIAPVLKKWTRSN